MTEAPQLNPDFQDMFIRAEPENAERVTRALRAFGAPLESHKVSAADFARRGTVYQIGLPPSRIDLLTEISGVEYDEARAASHSTVVSGLEFRVPGREHLIRNKRASGRPKDLEDARRLEAGVLAS